jgi:NAD(P)-dependent dehydrogenase (short-subunit alcohol dehydrogenase family)
LFRATLDVNLTGVFNTFQASFVKMNRAQPGRMIAIASTAGLKGYAYVSAYCAAKHGVVGLVRSLAQEFAKTGVTVNAICPGFTETPMLHRSIDNIVEKTGRSREEAEASLREVNPQGRFIQPEAAAPLAEASEGQPSMIEDELRRRLRRVRLDAAALRRDVGAGPRAAGPEDERDFRQAPGLQRQHHRDCRQADRRGAGAARRGAGQ